MPLVGLLNSQFNAIWSGGATGSSPEVPIPFIVAINGHLYLEDLEFKPWKRQAFRATTTSTTRTQADTSNEPGEQSLSTESLWRRTQDSWHEGAGQTFLDRKNSSEFAFRSSKGINPWTQWQISLLPDTTQALSSANTNLAVAVCGSHLYLIDGQALKFTTDLSSWTTVTGTPAVTASSLCSDGHTVYVAYGASGVYSTTEGAASATQYVTTGVDATSVIRFTMGRLMIGKGAAIYNIIATGALPTALFTSNISGFTWNDFASGLSVIYASGTSGDKSTIYRIGIATDGTTLSAPVVAGQLPYGETVSALYGYVNGVLAIGTSQGWRFAEQATTAGDLNIGPLPAVGTFPLQSVGAFSGYNRFVWGAYSNYDNTSTGLFRMDPSTFTADVEPAWASDLMATAQGAVLSVAHFNGTPVFTVSGVGVYGQATTYVASGSIDSGLITYGLADKKMPVFVDLSHGETTGTIATWVSLDSGPFSLCGTIATPNTTFDELPTPQVLSESIEIREVLTAGPGNTVTPVLSRHTLRSVPAPAVPTDWNVVIQLRERAVLRDVSFPMVPSAEYAYLDNLRETKQLCTLQVGNMGPYTVTIESIDWIPEQVASLTGELNGVAVITARTVV